MGRRQGAESHRGRALGASESELVALPEAVLVAEAVWGVLLALLGLEGDDSLGVCGGELGARSHLAVCVCDKDELNPVVLVLGLALLHDVGNLRQRGASRERGESDSECVRVCGAPRSTKHVHVGRAKERA